MWCSYCVLVLPHIIFPRARNKKLARPIIFDGMETITHTCVSHMNMSNHFGSRSHMEYTNVK